MRFIVLILALLSAVALAIGDPAPKAKKATAALTPKAAASEESGPPSAEKILNTVKGIEKAYQVPEDAGEKKESAVASEVEQKHKESVHAVKDAQQFKDAIISTAKKHVMELKGIKEDPAAKAQAAAAAALAAKAKLEGAPTGPSLLEVAPAPATGSQKLANTNSAAAQKAADVAPAPATGLQKLANTNSAAAQKAADQHPAILKLASDTAPLPTHCADKDPTDATHTLVNNSPKAVVLNTGKETSPLEKEVLPQAAAGMSPNELLYKSVPTSASLTTDPRTAFKIASAMKNMEKDRIVRKVVVQQLCEDGSCPEPNKEE